MMWLINSKRIVYPKKLKKKSDELSDFSMTQPFLVRCVKSGLKLNFFPGGPYFERANVVLLTYLLTW